jgi:hypothetical protein
MWCSAHHLCVLHFTRYVNRFLPFGSSHTYFVFCFCSRPGDTIYWDIPWCFSVRSDQNQCPIRATSIWIKKYSCYRPVIPKHFFASHSPTGNRRPYKQKWIALCNNYDNNNITWGSLLLPWMTVIIPKVFYTNKKFIPLRSLNSGTTYSLRHISAYQLGIMR